MKLYRNGVEVTDSTTPKLAIKNSDLLAADITSIAIQPQLNVRTTTVGYFKAYSLEDEFACAVKDVAHTDSIMLKTTRPLDIAGTTADVAGNPATITEVEGEFCKYNVAFASALVPGQNYELNVNAKSYTGQTETAVLPFTVTDDTLMRNAETQILNADGVEIGSVSDVTDNKVYTKLNIYANEATEYVVFTGIFNKDRTKLLSVEKKTGNIGANKNQIVNMSTNLPEIEDAQDLDVAVFVWKTVEGNVLLPITSVTLN